MTALGFLMLAACGGALWAAEEKRLSFMETLSKQGQVALVGALSGYVILILGITFKLWEVMP